jgi:hypothetical protein
MPTLSELKEAVAIAEQIQKLQTELDDLVGGAEFPTVAATLIASSAVKTGNRFFSPESRAKMAAAQAARWAKTKKPNAGPATAVAISPKAKGKRVLSPEGRARIVAALKARHAAPRKAKA